MRIRNGFLLMSLICLLTSFVFGSCKDLIGFGYFFGGGCFSMVIAILSPVMFNNEESK